ncbi:uncharacterized protein I303_106737 [Kwoniella dejecticola CBS 10117]|uniref:MIT domain-containing protein n=1 Tax=Kwoniella dejecticola CBS 10117 TaxID=1296121 RepID=A0A1A5ZTX5_9TREE|nr:uncharacterized protein I303_08620 [Kwoniella dejecticola CBS 10117]OBR81235.1 hypothetical protein I303_08620 [Kwoniella dejecticola CBS 10117]
MEEMISRSESGLKPNHTESGGPSDQTQGQNQRLRNISSASSAEHPSSPDPSTPTNPIPPSQNHNDVFLDVATKWGGEHETRNNAVRSSRMIGNRIGVSPPPPPGPPPSDPPPLPPASSSHPFASSSRPRPSARLSSLSSLRKSNFIPSRPSSPAGPPPTNELPPIPSSSSSASPPHPFSVPMSANSSSATSSESRPTTGHVRQLSQSGNAPTVSPRSSSLFQKQAQAGPSSAGDSGLGTPITLNKKLPEQSTSHAGPSQSSKPPRTPSRHLLQTALDLAQKAVEMDKNNDVLGALAAYREAVSRLKAVMERVGVESSGEKKGGRKGNSEEEGRTLRGIHDAYVARIQLLSSYETPNSDHGPPAEAGPSTRPTSIQHSAPPAQSAHPSTSTATLVPPSQESQEGTPRPSLDDGGMTGIGNFMLTGNGDQSFDTSASASASVSPVRPKAAMISPPVPQPQPQSQATPPFSSLPPHLNNSTPDINGATSALRAPLTSGDSNSHQRGSIPAIGLGYPSSPPNMTRPSGPAGTPIKSPVSSNSLGGDSAGSPSSTKSRLKRPNRPSMGLDMEADLSGIDGIQEQEEEVEMLARTPREGQSHIPSSKTVPDSPQSARSIDRPLPPLPSNSNLDQNGQPLITSRGASLTGASKPLPTPGALLVSPTTAQGTISQRRQSRPLSGTLATIVDQQQQPQETQTHQQQQPQVASTSSAFPVSSSGSSIRSISASSGTRIRAKSQPGHRPIVDQPISNSVPPVPKTRLKHKSSFSSSSQLNAAGILPQISRQSVLVSGPTAIQPNGLRIETNQGYNQGHVPAHGQGLAPPANISNSYRTGSGSGIGASPRSLPPLPDTAMTLTSTSTSFGGGGGGGGSLMSPVPETQPSEVLHRPFHLLRILHNSMDPEAGGSYLTGSIHISSAIWYQPNSNSNSNSNSRSGKMLIPPPKIIAQEIKIRVLEGLILTFESIRITGQGLLNNQSIRDHRRGSSSTSTSITHTQTHGASGGHGNHTKLAEDFCVSLDELDEEMDNTHKVLSKNGVGVGAWKGKKHGGTTKSWGSRISRSMDKMTSSGRSTHDKSNLEGTDKYVELLESFCIGAQIINDHLLNFTSPSGECTSAYAILPEKPYRNIEARLRRISEFIGLIIVPFILDDLKQFLLRYLKSGVKYLED